MRSSTIGASPDTGSEATPQATAQVATAQVATDAAAVPTYRGDAARTGVMPGPGPTGQAGIAWQFDAETGGFSNSPVAADGVVYAAGSDGAVRAIDLVTGDERWVTTLPNAISATPVIDDDLLIVSDDLGTVHGLSRADGSKAWTSEIGGGISGSPALVGDDLLVATTAGRLHKVDPTNGQERVEALDVGGGVTRSVAAADGTAYLGIAGDLVAVDLAAWDVRWRSPLAGGIGDIGTPTVAGDLVYAATGLGGDSSADYGVVAVHASSGEEVWRYVSPTGATLYTPAVSGDQAFIVGHDRLMVALEAGDGSAVWSVDLASELEALPSVVDDVVFTVGNDGPAVAVDASSGSVLWTVPTVGVPFAPTIVDGYLLVGTDAGILYAIGAS